MDLRGRLWALILQISFIMPLCRPSHPINSLCSNKGRDINVSQQLWANNEKIQSNSRCSAAAAMPDGNNSDWILIDSQYSSRVWWNALERGIKPICRLLSHSTFHTHTHTPCRDPLHASYSVRWSHSFMLYASALRAAVHKHVLYAGPIIDNMRCAKKPIWVCLIPIGC